MTKSTAIDEPALLAACRRGAPEAFRPIVECYQARIFTVALRMLGDRHEAEDLAQETFIKAYTALNRYDPGQPFSTWLYRIAINTCIDRLRKRREVASSEIEVPQEPAAQALVERAEAGVAVQRALAQLPANYRTILILKDMEGLDYDSIAAILGGSRAALKIRVVRGRALLCAIIRKMYPELLPTV